MEDHSANDTAMSPAGIRDIVTGTGLVVLGIAGLFLPVLPGWLWLIPGLLLIAGRVSWVRAGLNRLLSTRGGQAFIDRLATLRATRKAAIQALRDRRIRRALTTPTRHRILTALLSRPGGQHARDHESVGRR